MTGRTARLCVVVAGFSGGCSGCSYDWSLGAGGPDAASTDASSSASSGADGGDAGSLYRATILGDSPAFYWRLGDTSGTSAFDEVTHSLDATYEGGVTLGQPGALAGDPDAAVLLDGTSGCIDAGDVADFAGDAAFSLEAWIRPEAVPDGSYLRVFNKQSADGNQSYSVALTTTGLLFQRYVGGDQRALSIPPPSPDVYTYIAATYDGATLRLYSESAVGELTQAIADDRAIPSIATALEIGCRPSVATTYFKGRLDEVAVYARALTAADVARHYEVGVGRAAGD
jgi:hypothetical protein